MKNVIAVALLLVGISGFAQEKKSAENRKQQREGMEKLSLEQRNELQLKQLTLELDLSASQQKEMAKIIAEQNLKREAEMTEIKAMKESNKKLTADERFVMKNKMLDEKIALKDKVKKVLTPEQLEKWEKIKKDKRRNFKKDPKKFNVKKLGQKEE